MQTNSFWLTYVSISSQLQNDDAADEANSYNTLLSNVNPLDVKKMAGKHLSGNIISGCF